MILVDSSVWIDFFSGRATRETELLASLIKRRVLLIGDLILIEVLQGFRGDAELRDARAALGSLPCAAMVGEEIALASVMNYRALRQRGITVGGTIAVIIATFCIENGHVLLHADRDFETLREHLGLRTI